MKCDICGGDLEFIKRCKPRYSKKDRKWLQTTWYRCKNCHRKRYIEKQVSPSGKH